MRAVAVVDTSVLCELLAIPGLCAAASAWEDEWRRRIKRGERFLVPLTTVIETGNHVGQIKDGALRRAAAERFVRDVQLASAGRLPFVTAPLPSLPDVDALIARFVEWATRGSGLGDLSLVQVFERQAALNPDRRVYIWTQDAHLAGYDTGPRGP